jgi:hypothetical protein
MADFYLIISQCKNMIEKYKNHKNEIYMDELEKELPSKDLEGQQIAVTGFKMEIPEGQEVNEDYIAEVRNRFRAALFLYQSKKSRWLTLYKEIQSLITDAPSDLDLNELKELKNNRNIDEMKLKPKPNSPKVIGIFRFLSIIGVFISIFVIAT